MDDRPWYDRWPERLARIHEGLRAEGWTVADQTFDDEHETVVLTVTGLPGSVESMEVHLPPSTSAVPTVTSEAPLPLHWHPSGHNLCLPRDASEPVAALRAAITLYEAYERGGISALRALGVEAAEPRTEYLGIRDHACLTASDLPRGRWGTFRLRGHIRDLSSWGWVRSFTSEPATDPYDTRIPATIACDPTVDANLRDLAGTLPERSGVWVRSDERQFSLDAEKLVRLWHDSGPDEARQVHADLLALERPQSRPGRPVPLQRIVRGLVVPEEGPGHSQWGERLVLLIERPGLQTTAVVAEGIGPDFARIPGYDTLTDRTVAVAGLGMLGAPIVNDLARTGVGTLRLLDLDAVETGNLVRQDFSVLDIGRSKARAVRDQVRLRAPWCDVPAATTISARVGRATRREIAEWIDGSDLLVLATADWRAEVFLSHVAADLGIPVVGCAVTFGVWGGYAWRTRWGTSGCRLCFEHDPSRIRVPVDPAAPGGLFVRGCGQPTFPGHAADGSVVSAVAVRYALAELVPGSPQPPEDVAAITFRNASDLVGPTVAWRASAPHSDCDVCEGR